MSIAVTPNPRGEEILQSAQHVLFVEGKDQTALDPTVLRELLPMLTVKALGGAYHIQSAAEALFRHHPTYYFLIDRDHYDDETVERTWKQFPDPERSNILIWRRRELENYFIIPEYAALSQYCRDAGKLRHEVLRCCRQRVYFDAANAVLAQVREELKQNWITLFTNPDEITSRGDALDKLVERREFSRQSQRTARILGKETIQARLQKILELFTDGQEPLEYGCGKWLEFISGKPIFASVAGKCFEVRDLKGVSLQGSEQQKEIAKDLLRLDFQQQPPDFQELHKMIQEKILRRAGSVP